MTENTKSMKDRLAELKAKTGDTATTARAKAEEAISRIDGATENVKSEAAQKSRDETLKAERAAEKPSEKVGRILAGDEKRNIKNLYGLASAFNAIMEPLGKLSKVVGLTSLFNKGAKLWDEYGAPFNTAFNVVAFVPKKVVGAWWEAEKWGFKTFAYKNGEDGERVMSNKRGAAFILASAAMTAGLIAAVPPTADFIYDAGMYSVTAKTETMWMTGTDTVSEDSNIYTAGACHQLPCNESNSVFYKIRPSIFLEMKSLWDSKGKNYWQPETQVAAIPEVTSRCIVTSAGMRIKALKWYPYIIDTECSHQIESTEHVSASDLPPPAIVIPHAAPSVH